VLLGVLSQAIGVSADTPDYSEDYVKRLVADASGQGVAARGATLFQTMACTSCHQLSGTGGGTGPDLTALGSTLSAERIVEELLWPNRQIKEGYSVVQVITDEGRIHQGYERRTKESQKSGDLVIQDLVTSEFITIKTQHIEETQVTGSPMPAGITELLSRPQLLDLIRYLSELGRIK
jgi:putative heme-binding domain-containing protein